MSNSTTNENKAEAPEKEDAITNYIRDTDLQSVIAGLWWTQGKTEIGQNSKRSLKRSRLKRPLLLTVPPHNNFQLNISGHTSKCRRPLFNEIFPPFCLKIFSILCSAAGSNSSVSGIEFVWKREKIRLAWPPFPAGHQRPDSRQRADQQQRPPNC